MSQNEYLVLALNSVLTDKVNKASIDGHDIRTYQPLVSYISGYHTCNTAVFSSFII